MIVNEITKLLKKYAEVLEKEPITVDSDGKERPIGEIIQDRNLHKAQKEQVELIVESRDKLSILLEIEQRYKILKIFKVKITIEDKEAGNVFVFEKNQTKNDEVNEIKKLTGFSSYTESLEYRNFLPRTQLRSIWEVLVNKYEFKEITGNTND